MGKNNPDHESQLLVAILAENGFDVDLSPPHQTPQQAVRMAIDNDVHVICFISTGNQHKDQVTDLSNILKSEHAENIRVVISGPIPHSDYAFLYEAGVSLILNSAPADTLLINRLLDLFD
jgi:methylmalonyl-CoA mutase